MGNCLSNKSLALVKKEEELPSEAEMVEQTEPTFTPSSKLEASVKSVETKKKKKMVRFKLEEDNNVGGRRSDHSASRSGVVRIRVVVSKKELKEILDCKEGFKYSSVEQLVNAMKLRGRRISEVRTSTTDQGGINSSWKPDLESIPEDH